MKSKSLYIVLSIGALGLLIYLIATLDFNNLGYQANSSNYLGILAMLVLLVSNIQFLRNKSR